MIPSATLTLTLPRGAEAEVMNRFRSRKSPGRTGIAVELGDLVSAQELDVVIRVKFPLGDLDETVTVSAALDGETSAVVEFMYASHSANDEQPRNAKVDREVARVFVGRARAEATEANRRGDFDRAYKVLDGTARRITEYAGEDVELNALAMALRDEVPQYTEQTMAPMAMKAAFFVAESSVRGRDVEGKARRSSQ